MNCISPNNLDGGTMPQRTKGGGEKVMNENGKKIRDFVWNLKLGEVVTYGYIAKKFNREGLSAQAIKEGASEDDQFPWWRMVS